MSESFEAIIVGGGVIGASTLFQLTALGCRNVLLLERGELAGGATANSSGIVRTHYSVDANVRIARASLSMLESLSELVGDPDAEAGLIKSGYIIVAPPGPSSDAIRTSVAAQQALGIDARILDHNETRDRHPWLQLDDIDAIGFEAEAGFADPYLVTTAFARAARRNGATIRTKTAVTGLLRDGERVVGVETASGAIWARTVLLAANVWTGDLAASAGLRIPLALTVHHVFTLAAEQPYTADLPVVKDLASASRLYTRPSGGHLLVGAGHEGETTNDPEVSQVEASMDVLAEEASQAAHRMPAFAEGRFVRSWSGLYDTTPDWNPVLGPVPDISGLQVAFGFSGHGFKLSPMIGRMLAQSLLGHPPDLPIEPYRLSRFKDGALLTGRYGFGAVS